ncbi:MAG: anti-sigma factor family protein [Thermoanaerobaculia bacterium]
MDRHWSNGDIERYASGSASPDHEHLRDCARCANAVAATVQMKRAVREAMQVDPAPHSLRKRLTRQPTSSRVNARWWIAAAAMIATITVSIALLRAPSPDALPELVDLHGTLVASANAVDVVSTDQHTVKPWFEGRVPFAVPVPDLSATPFRLIGGRVVYWRSHQGAYLLIGKSAHRISLFVFRQEDAPAHLGQAPAEFSTLSWNDGGLTFVAVGGVTAEDLRQLRAAFHRE